MCEIWKSIIGYEGHYEISNLGRIKSTPLKERGGNIKKYTISKSGYFTVGLFINGKNRTFLVHRLIAINFIKNEFNKPYINHKNGIKTDNSINNLEWATAKENVIHGWDNGLCENTRKIGSLNLKSKKVINTITGKIYNTIKEAANESGLNYNTFFGYVSGSNKNPTSFKIVDKDINVLEKFRTFVSLLNIETGIFYDNIKEAAIAYNLDYSLLYRRLKKNNGLYKSFLLLPNGV